jgi:hypothetical protein
MRNALLSLLFIPSLVMAEPCFSPACPVPEYQLCFATCAPVQFTTVGAFTLASSQLPNGYPVVGWSGPCFDGNCPDVKNQAFADLELNAKRANRAQRYE